MSRRRIEAGATTAGSFSLRSISSEPASAHAPVAARTAAAPPANPQQASLSFKFSSLGAGKPTSPPRAGEPARLPTNFFSKAPAGATRDNAEVLRLTAVVDDLSQRLRKVSDTKNQLEGQVQRTNAAMVQERSNSASRISALKSEVVTAQDDQMRLRTELAQRPAVKEVDATKWHTRVRSALEQEETNARVADAEARCSTLNKRYESLTAEVKLLEGRKNDALANATSTLSPDEVEALVEKAALLMAEVAALEDQRANIEDGIARFTALRDAHKSDAAEAERALHKANEATATAVADESAAKAQCGLKQQEVEGCTAKLAQLQEKLGDLNAAAAAPTTFRVTGAAAPAAREGPVASTVAQVEAMGCCHTGLAYHFGYDAPVHIGKIVPAVEAQDDTAAMVNALVGDLQAFFQFAAEDHAKIGRVEVPAPPPAIEAA